MPPIAASKKIILTINFKRCLIQSRRFWKRRQSVFPLFIGFVYNVIVVFVAASVHVCGRCVDDVAFTIVVYIRDFPSERSLGSCDELK